MLGRVQLRFRSRRLRRCCASFRPLAGVGLAPALAGSAGRPSLFKLSVAPPSLTRRAPSARAELPGVSLVGWTFGAERPGGEARPGAATGDPGPEVLTSRARPDPGHPTIVSPVRVTRVAAQGGPPPGREPPNVRPPSVPESGPRLRSRSPPPQPAPSPRVNPMNP